MTFQITLDKNTILWYNETIRKEAKDERYERRHENGKKRCI
jgi:hypothetical protein